MANIKDALPGKLESALSERGGKKIGREIRFTCPNSSFHNNNDVHPSANYNPEKKVWICRSCGESGNYYDLAIRLGLIQKKHSNDGFKETRRWNVGKFSHVRLEKPGEKKQVIWEKEGKPGLGGYKLEDMPLYGIENIKDKPEADVILSEGEGKSDSLSALEFIALGTVCGAGVTPSREVLKPLAEHKGKVFLARDNDKSGESHMQNIAARLKAMGKQVYMVSWPGVPKKGDAADFIKAGAREDEIKAVLLAAPLYDGEAEPQNSDEPYETDRSPIEEDSTGKYTINSRGEVCLIKYHPHSDRPMLIPLCNFNAHIEEEITIDNSIETKNEFLLVGKLTKGQPLPKIRVPASDFNSLSWIPELWGARAYLYAGSSVKDHVRARIQMMSEVNGIRTRHIYTHTGWREDDDGHRFFLSASGALGFDGVEVDLRGPLAKYRLPLNPNEVKPDEAMKASLEFLRFGNFDVMSSLWAEMYLAPLVVFLNPAFTLWMVGHTGSFKSVLSALALCHFGDFTYLSLPASWRNTANQLEQLLAMCKDMPCIVDDFHPQPNSKSAKELEDKAEVIIRGQGNKAGRGRLKSDITFREDPVPRGLVISSGEQLPEGESVASRLFVVEVERGDVNIADLREAQKKATLYKHSMSHYILWIRDNWDRLKTSVPEAWETYRDQALAEGGHLRLPAAVAWLYTGLEQGLSYAAEIGVIGVEETKEILDRGWETFIKLSARQGARVDSERPSSRFLKALSIMLQQRRVVTAWKGNTAPDLKGNQSFIGWNDDNCYYLLPDAVHGAVCEFYSKGTSPFTFKASAVWSDLARLGYTKVEDNRNMASFRVPKEGGGTIPDRGIVLKKSALYIDSKNIQGHMNIGDNGDSDENEAI